MSPIRNGAPAYEALLSGGDLRSIGNSNKLVDSILCQQDFDRLFQYIHHKDRIIAMRAADVIEKITVGQPAYLGKYKEAILSLLDHAENKELKWHLALLVPRMDLSQQELSRASGILISWLKDSVNSRIVRVNALQSLFELTFRNPELREELLKLLPRLEKEAVPSITARIRKIRQQIIQVSQ